MDVLTAVTARDVHDFAEAVETAAAIATMDATVSRDLGADNGPVHSRLARQF